MAIGQAAEGGGAEARDAEDARAQAVARRLRLLEDFAETQALLDGLDFDLEGFMETAVDRLAATTGAFGVVVELVEGDEMVYRACSAAVRGHLGTRLKRAGSLSGLCVERGEILVCEDADTDPRVDREACRRVGARSMLCAPLSHSGRVVGAVKLTSPKPAAFGPDEIEALTFTVKSLAAALKRQIEFQRQLDAVDALEAEAEARRRLEDSLRASQARLSRIISGAHEAVVTTDRDARITGWNPHAEQLFGWAAREVMGLDVIDLLLPPSERSARREGFQDFLAAAGGSGGERWELGIVRRDGQGLPVEISMSLVDGAAGHEVLILMHDISERRAQTELFETAFRHAAIGKALVSLDGRFMKVNPALCELLGYEEDRLLGLDFQAITHPDDLEADLGLLTELTAGRIANYRLDKRYYRADGAEVSTRLAVSMVVNADGSPRHYIAQIEDLTARREAEAALRDSEARYRLIAQNTSDMIVTCDLTGVATFASAACTAITGLTPDQVVGRRPMDFAHPDDVGPVRRVFVNTAAGAPGGRVRWRGRHDNGSWLWLESNPTLLRHPDSGRPIGFLDVIRDISEQVAQELALDAARLEAEAATAVKSDFLANMSHEIRTPLTAILGFTSLLSDRRDLDEAARLHVRRVSTASDALLAIVNDVLDFSKLEAGQFEIAPRAVSPRETASDALAMFLPQAEAKGLELVCEIADDLPERARIDPDRVRQILLNLIGNAVKFTEQGSIALRLGYDVGAEMLRFEVADTGPGLSQAQQDKLFQRFSQVDGSSTRKHGGTGLGLAISKGLSEVMGGGIGVRSTPGEGAVFHFHIHAPAASAEAARELEPAAPGGGLDGLRVLVVDDNAINRELAQILLTPLGLEVTLCDNGHAAAEIARTALFDVILLDLNMPGLSGSETLDLIQGGGGPNTDIPILAFSADSDLSRAPEGHRFAGHVKKPIVLGELVATLIACTQGFEDEAEAAWSAGQATRA